MIVFKLNTLNNKNRDGKYNLKGLCGHSARFKVEIPSSNNGSYSTKSHTM